MTLDFTGWGWVHLVVGVIVVVAGLCVMAGQIWARTVGVLLAGLSLLANVAFLAAYPLWSIVMIALDDRDHHGAHGPRLGHQARRVTGGTGVHVGLART